MSLQQVRSGKTPGTAGRRSVAYRDTNGKTWEAKVLSVSTTINATDASRTANVVTATGLPAGHGLTVGKVVGVDFADNTYDGIFTLTGVTATTAQWAQTAADDPSAGAGTILVGNAVRLELVSMRSARASRIRDHVTKAATMKSTDAYFYSHSPTLTLA